MKVRGCSRRGTSCAAPRPWRGRTGPHLAGGLARRSPRSQTPVWERRSAKLRFALAGGGVRNGVSGKAVPKPEFGNQKERRFPNRGLGTRRKGSKPQRGEERVLLFAASSLCVRFFFFTRSSCRRRAACRRGGPRRG